MEFFKGFCSFLAGVLGLYSFLIVVRIMLSWVVGFNNIHRWRSGYGNSYGYNDPRNPNNASSGIESVANFLGKITDPYLNLFKGISSLRRSRVDFTPVVALVILNIVQSLLEMVARTGRVSIGVLLAIAIQGLWSSLFAYLFILLIILLILRYFIGRSSSYQAQNWLNAIDPILDSPVKRVYKIFFRKTLNPDDQKIVLISIFFYIAVFVILKIFVGFLVNFLVSL